LPIQDVFGWKDRINTPALINDDNWTWRLPWLVEDMRDQPVARERAAFARRLASKFGR
jgi:4-alpha-glucanotransferase